METVKNIYVLPCWVAFFCMWSSASSLFAPNGVSYDVIALMGIKSYLVDPHGVLGNWDETSRDPCSWNMVTCSPDGLVVALRAPSQDLSGTLSPTIGNLTNIKIVLLQNNNISGALPSEIESLSELQTLDLSNNDFSGQIPTAWSYLKALNYLRLNNNSLSGEIPASLANMTQLDLLDLSFNNLSGPVPVFSAKTFNIVGNPHICSNGSERVGGCAQMDSGLSFNSSNSKLNYSSGINKSRIFFIIVALISYALAS